MYTRIRRGGRCLSAKFPAACTAHSSRNSKRRIHLPEVTHGNTGKRSQARDRKSTRNPTTVIVPLGRGAENTSRAQIYDNPNLGRLSQQWATPVPARRAVANSTLDPLAIISSRQVRRHISLPRPPSRHALSPPESQLPPSRTPFTRLARVDYLSWLVGFN